jgi:hypothetical protein
MLQSKIGARIAGGLALAATVLCLGLTSTASAGTPIANATCSNWPVGTPCQTYVVNVPTYTVYARVEMQGYHCADVNGVPSTQGCGFGSDGGSNYVYSNCWYPPHASATYGQGWVAAGFPTTLTVILFHATSSSDCTLASHNR